MAWDRDAAIAEMLAEVTVLGEGEAAERRASLQRRTGEPAMFTRSLEEVSVFVPMMVNLTEQALTSIPDMERVTVMLGQMPGVLQINYIQHWVGGAENAYGEDVIRTGDDLFEVFGGGKSAERMTTAWADRSD